MMKSESIPEIALEDNTALVELEEGKKIDLGGKIYAIFY